MHEPNYPEIIKRLKSQVEERGKKFRAKNSKYNLSKLKQSANMLKYWEEEYNKHKNNGTEAV